MTATPSDDELWRPIVAYATALDEKDFDALADVFHPDVVADYAGVVYTGVAPIIERMRSVHEHIGGSRHRLSNFRVLARTAGTASTATYVDAFLVGGAGAPGLVYRDVGTYVDQIVPFDGRWVVARREYQRLWRDGDVLALSEGST